MIHLVYCDNAGKRGEHVLDMINSGAKTMVVRGAAGRKIPHSRVNVGEAIYFMEKGSMQISAKAEIISVQNLERLSDEAIDAVLAENQPKLNLTDKQIVRWHKKYLCLVEFANVEQISPPLSFDKQSNMDDWLILDKIEDAVVGTSIPYNYEKSRLKQL